MNKNNFKEVTQHRKIFRHRGRYFSIAEESNLQFKKVKVNPGKYLSLQKHNRITDYRLIVTGEALIEQGKEEKKLFKNISLGCKHRLSNPVEEQLKLVEVQSGSYLGEDDIIRYEDNYGRKNN